MLFSRPNSLFYSVIALVLLMQSFAIWHDAQHPFHLEQEQCHHFESVSHTPSLDIVDTTFFASTFIFQRHLSTPILGRLTKQAQTNQLIRAPPHHFS